MATVNVSTVQQLMDINGKKLKTTMMKGLILNDEIEEENIEKISLGNDLLALAFSHFMCLKKHKHEQQENMILTTLAWVLKTIEKVTLSNMNHAGRE